MRLEIVKISDDLFYRLGSLVTETYGIKMSPEKKIMFEARLQRRLLDLQIDSFDEYAKRFSDELTRQEELRAIADFISTNKTEFFREYEHFDLLKNTVLPDVFQGNESAGKSVNIWSAGCSSGQEPYSIAMTVEEFIRVRNKTLNYQILATDISERMLRVAKKAVYPMSQVSGIPMDLKKQYMLKSKNSEDEKIRIVSSIREKVRIARLNLIEFFDFGPQKFDVVFLRNTLIYFSPEVQLSVLKGVIDNIRVGGYLFIGHSESLVNLDLPLTQVAPSVYMKIEKTKQYEP